jgi:hypothetical protein
MRAQNRQICNTEGPTHSTQSRRHPAGTPVTSNGAPRRQPAVAVVVVILEEMSKKPTDAEAWKFGRL